MAKGFAQTAVEVEWPFQSVAGGQNSSVSAIHAAMN